MSFASPFLLENAMKTLHFVVPALAVCSVSSALLVGDAHALAGPPITKQMSDTQRAAQTKALKSKSSAHDQAKKEGNKSPASAPAAQ